MYEIIKNINQLTKKLDEMLIEIKPKLIRLANVINQFNNAFKTEDHIIVITKRE